MLSKKASELYAQLKEVDQIPVIIALYNDSQFDTVETLNELESYGFVEYQRDDKKLVGLKLPGFC